MGVLYPNTPVVTEQFIARGDVDVVAVELDAAQSAVGTAPLEVDAARVPVNVLHNLAPLEVDRVDPAVALPLLGAADDGCGDELR